MKLHPTDLPYGKKQSVYNTSKLLFPGGIIALCFTIFVLSSASFSITNPIQSSWLPPDISIPTSNVTALGDSERVNKRCDLFKGEWVPNPDGPYYTNETCSGIYDHQNCMKFGRPDLDFVKWRWKPDDCDSVARNHMQSLMCLLSRVESPVEISNSVEYFSELWKDQQSKMWKFTNYNFTIANFWSPLLLKAIQGNQTKHTMFRVYLDEADEKWTAHIEDFDYVILSGGHWFFRPSMFYEEKQLVACHYCSDQNVTNVNTFYGYRKAFRTAMRAIYSMKNFKGVTFLRTFVPSHFENGEWDNGGNCIRTRPFTRNETHLDNSYLEMYEAQVEEFKAAEEEAVKRGLKFRLLDTTQAMLLRPDGHPSHYGHEPHPEWPNDCVHWCLPGPIDAWSDLLLELLNREL
ncbi:hypothetical protein ACHQM5_006865 [Ranunculus cassubicifolius]